MSEYTAQGIEAEVCADIASRQALGIRKYGLTVSSNPLPLRAWLQHQYEELLDAAVYAKRAIAEMDKKDRWVPDARKWIEVPEACTSPPADVDAVYALTVDQRARKECPRLLHADQLMWDLSPGHGGRIVAYTTEPHEAWF